MEKDIKYIHTERTHNLRAPRVVVPIIVDIFRPRSVIDVGCGIGTWLKCFKEAGINDLLGLDGSNVPRTSLLIETEFFSAVDFRFEFEVGRKFDLALCLEVIEHLPELQEEKFIESLTRLADSIVFSAAIPGQGGQNHINEKPLSYWINRFSAYGFNYFDVIRPLIWQNKDVDFWYRQNIVVFSRLPLVPSQAPQYIDLVHPELLSLKLQEIKSFEIQSRPTIPKAFKDLIIAFLRWP